METILLIELILLGTLTLAICIQVYDIITHKKDYRKAIHINSEAYHLKKQVNYGNDSRRKDKHNSRSTGKAQQGARKHGKSAKTNNRLFKHDSRTSSED